MRKTHIGIDLGIAVCLSVLVMLLFVNLFRKCSIKIYLIPEIYTVIMPYKTSCLVVLHGNIFGHLSSMICETNITQSFER